MKNTGGLSFEPGHYFDVVPDLICVTDLLGRFAQVDKAWNKVIDNPETNLRKSENS